MTLKPALTANRLCLLASVWVMVTANQSFWRLLWGEQSPGEQGWLFAASVAMALVGLHLLLFRLLTPGRTLRWMLSILLVVAAATGWFMDTYGVAIDTGMLRNAVQTNPGEARDFLGWPLLWRVTWQAALPIALLWWAPLRTTSALRSLRDYATGAVAGLALVLAAGLPMYSHYASFFRNQDVARYLVAPANVVVGGVNLARKSLRGRQPFVQVGLDAQRAALPRSSKPLIVVMVVGETARAANFSLGGYARNTNPQLEKAGVYYFRDVTSCGTATAVSVPCLFSDLPRAEFDLTKADRRDTVLDIAQRAGIHVSWIDNQSGCKGVCARVPTREAKIDHPESCADGECRDDALLFALSAELPRITDDGLVVLHSMGSHGPTYHLRVTPDFEVFKPVCPTERIEQCTREQIVNSYDNSIVYTDHILAGIIDQLRRREDVADFALLYVSDHGESLGENGLYLHGQPYVIAPEVQKKVPLLLWFSSGTEARLGIADRCLRDRLARPASHDNVSHTLLGLMEVGTRAYRPALDLLHDCRIGVARAS